MPGWLKGPWIVNGLVASGGGSGPSLGFTYMLKGEPTVDPGSAYLQAYTLAATALGVVQQSSLNVSLSFPVGHLPGPYGNSTTAMAMLVTGCAIELRSGGHMATLCEKTHDSPCTGPFPCNLSASTNRKSRVFSDGTYRKDGAMSPTSYSLVAVKSQDSGK